MAASRPETWQKAGEEILREVYRLRDELVGPEELAKAKKQKAAELVFGRQTVKQAADGLGRNFLTTGDPLFDKTYVEGIQKVTAEQVRDVARRYFVPERLNRVIIAPPGGAPKPAGKAAKAAEGEIRQVRLANGLRVLLKRHSQLPLVNIQAFVLGGSLVDDEATAGRAALVGAMLDMGTADHTARQIADYFDSIGGHLSMSAGPIHGVRQRHDAAGGFPRRGGPVCRVFHAADVSARRVRQGAAACLGGHRPAGRRSAPGNQRILLPTTCRPARPTTSFRAARPTRCESSPPRTCSSTTPSISCRTTWS